MFERTAKPTSRSLPAKGLEAAAHEPPLARQSPSASALPSFGFAALSVHPPGHPPAPTQLQSRPAMPPIQRMKKRLGRDLNATELADAQTKGTANYEAKTHVRHGKGKEKSAKKIEKEDESSKQQAIDTLIQLKPAPAQLQSRPARPPMPNRTGLPDRLKSGVEALSGVSLDGVKVHYGSQKPAALNAHAYAQGREIHLAPGQERHLPHEAWHLVQQAQGRVRPTMRMKGGVAVNDDHGLEREADGMGARAANWQSGASLELAPALPGRQAASLAPGPAGNGPPLQAMRRAAQAFVRVVRAHPGKVTGTATLVGAGEYQAYKSRNPAEFNSNLAPEPLTRQQVSSPGSSGSYYGTRAINMPTFLPQPVQEVLGQHMRHSATFQVANGQQTNSLQQVGPAYNTRNETGSANVGDFDTFHRVNVPDHHMASAMEAQAGWGQGPYAVGPRGVARVEGFNVCHNHAHATVNLAAEQARLELARPEAPHGSPQDRKEKAKARLQAELARRRSGSGQQKGGPEEE